MRTLKLQSGKGIQKKRQFSSESVATATQTQNAEQLLHQSGQSIGGFRPIPYQTK